MAKHSDRYATIDKATTGKLARELDSLAKLFVNSSYKLISIEEGRIGVCAEILTKANSKSCLHRAEPVVIVLDLDNWQTIPPFVFPDRTDFPYPQFPHVFYEGTKYPAGLCLTRENIRDWYSEHTLKDYLIRLNEWMQDAARQNLIKINNKDEYEPQRYLNPTLQTTFYRLFYDDVFLEKQTQSSCHFSTLKVYDETNVAFGSDEISIPGNNALCIRLFRGNKYVDNEWINRYPHTIGELYNFIVQKEYPWDAKEMLSKLDATKEYVYFMIALLRPAKIIGKESRINYLCFRARSSDIINDKKEACIDEVLVIDYPNLGTARKLSLTPETIFSKRVAVLGCGALGSKLVLHLYRSGVGKLTLVDNDFFEPHNMCRHALLCTPFDKGRKKVDLMKDALNGMFLGVSDDHIETYDIDAISYLKCADLDKLSIIIDSTASAAVMHGMDTIQFPDSTKVIRTCLSQGGNIGIISVTTGSKRLQSDYYVEILRRAISDDDISVWLNKEKEHSLEDVNIGEGCHSYTMRISDDIISSHAALMSSVIRHINEPKSQDGFMLSFSNNIFPGSMSTTWYNAPDYCEYICDNEAEWKIRIHRMMLNEIKQKTRANRNKEVGGYLFGLVDHKRQLIYVISGFIPEDSKHYTSKLELSKKGFHKYEKIMTERTAGQIFYIGDWHSHPSFPLTMSEIDLNTCRNRVFPAMKDGIGICIIAKATDIKAFLVSSKL